MKIDQVALQLYTLREHLKTPSDIATSLKKVREIGYSSVQASGMGPIPEADFVQILKEEGLTLCATHESGPEILNETEKVIERLHKLDCKHTAYPYPAGINFGEPGAVAKLAAELDVAGAKMKAAGLTLSYHNHGNEFFKIDGVSILESIYALTNPAHLAAELDTYWVQYGGANPVDWCKKMAGRMPLLHLKDFSCGLDNKAYFCEIGNGNLDFHGIIAAAEDSGCEWFIVEQDSTPGDPFDSVKISYDYIRKNLVNA